MMLVIQVLWIRIWTERSPKRIVTVDDWLNGVDLDCDDRCVVCEEKMPSSCLADWLDANRWRYSCDCFRTVVFLWSVQCTIWNGRTSLACNFCVSFAYVVVCDFIYLFINSPSSSYCKKTLRSPSLFSSSLSIRSLFAVWGLRGVASEFVLTAK